MSPERQVRSNSDKDVLFSKYDLNDFHSCVDELRKRGFAGIIFVGPLMTFASVKTSFGMRFMFLQ